MILPRSHQDRDTLTRMDVDSEGLKTHIIPNRHPPKTQLPTIHLLDPPPNEADPIDGESDEESDGEDTTAAPSQVSAHSQHCTYH